MRFIVDAQLPPALARLMAACGLQAEHVIDVGLHDSEDSSIWQYAIQQNAVVVTKDEDFPRRWHRSQSRPTILWLRIGNTSRRALLQWFEPLIPQIILMLENGERLIEIRYQNDHGTASLPRP